MFYNWCSTLSGVLHAYHKARKTTFKFLTPYSLVVDPEGNIHLLDLEANANLEIKEYLKDPLVREYFAYPSAKRCYTNTYLVDYYSFAKIIQFMISQVHIEPNFTKKEIKKIKSVVERCFSESCKESYKNMKTVEYEFNKINKKHI